MRERNDYMHMYIYPLSLLQILNLYQRKRPISPGSSDMYVCLSVCMYVCFHEKPYMC